MPLQYHQGQIEIQTEANTRPIADLLANWVGPVGEFCSTADMIVMAVPAEDSHPTFMVLSGAAPLIEAVGPSSIFLPLPEQTTPAINGATSCGGLAISLAVARRARLNGRLRLRADGLVLEASEAFTNCRKYIAPSVALESERHFGPASREPLPLTDLWLADVIQKAETSFLASISPTGVVDVSHRGGPAGFLRFDGTRASLEWDEYVGDGMFKSAGNIRATGRISLLVPELASGDAVELSGSATVEVVRRERQPRTMGLVQQSDDFPVQGRISSRIESAYQLRALMHPRGRIEKRLRVTSASSIREQAPQ